jgi:predicted component of type VI protein secretion system
MPYLEFEQQLRQVGPGVLTIGSGTEASWRILGRELAPLHVIITPERDGRAVVKRGAPYAEVFLNDAELPDGRGVLGFGDRLRVGGAEFVYRQTAHQGRSREGFLRDTRRGRVYMLNGILEMGRDPRCEVLLTEPEVSRLHAEVHAKDGHFWVVPVGTAYTLLNHERLHAPTELKEGDEITIGRTALRFTTEAPSSTLAKPVVGTPHANVDKRAAKMQTVFMGALQAREKIKRRDMQRVSLIVAAVIAVLTAVVLLFN